MEARISICPVLAVLLCIAGVVAEVQVPDKSADQDNTIYGHVYDASTRQPLSQAFVYCLDIKSSKQVSDRAGYYSLEGSFSPSITYTIRCTKNGYKTSAQSVTLGQNGKAIADIYLEAEESNSNGKQIPEIVAPIIEDFINNETENVTLDYASSNLPLPNLRYIWSFTGIESDAITMVLDQEGNDLFGQSKYEPEGGKAWNAEVVGSIVDSVSGNDVKLTMAVQKDTEIVTTQMIGSYADDTINGNFTQVSGGRVVKRGSFTALWISPDISSYIPAVIEEEPGKKSKFVDVRVYQDKIGPGGDLAGVPPGMGGL